LLLTQNPDYYSAWNFRRVALPKVYSSAEELLDILRKEIKWLTCSVLPINPKSYWVWNHRRWCLHQIESQHVGDNNSLKVWKEELALADAFLNVDSRNCKLHISFVLKHLV
jgi:geranylgeranyl transferase type-2 subunit alpha